MDTMMNKLWKIAMCISMLLTLLPMDIGMAEESIVDAPIVANENHVEEEIPVDGQPAGETVEETENGGEDTPTVEGTSEETGAPETGVEVTGEVETEFAEDVTPEKTEEEKKAAKIEEIIAAIRAEYDVNTVELETVKYNAEKYEGVIASIRKELEQSTLEGLADITPDLYETKFVEAYSDEYKAKIDDNLNLKKQEMIAKIEKDYAADDTKFYEEKRKKAVDAVVKMIQDSTSLASLNSLTDVVIGKVFEREGAYKESYILEERKKEIILTISKKYENKNGEYKEPEFKNLMTAVTNNIHACKTQEDLDAIDMDEIDRSFKDLLTSKGSFEVARREKLEWVRKTYPFDEELNEKKAYDDAMTEIEKMVANCNNEEELNAIDDEIKKLMDATLTKQGEFVKAKNDKYEELLNRYPFDESLYMRNDYEKLVNKLHDLIESKKTSKELDTIVVEAFAGVFEGIRRPEDLVITKDELEDFSLKVGNRVYTFDELQKNPNIEMSTTEEVEIHINARVWNDGSTTKEALTGKKGVAYNQRVVMDLPELIDENTVLKNADNEVVSQWVGFFADKGSDFGKIEDNNVKFASFMKDHPEIELDFEKLKKDPKKKEELENAVAVYRIVPIDGKNKFILEYPDEYILENERQENDIDEYPADHHGGVRNLQITLKTKINKAKAEKHTAGKFLQFGNIDINVKFHSAKRITNLNVEKFYQHNVKNVNGEEAIEWRHDGEVGHKPLIYTQRDTDTVYYKVKVTADPRNTEDLQDVLVSEVIDHKKLKNLRLHQATKYYVRTVITDEIQEVKMSEVITDQINEELFDKKNVESEANQPSLQQGQFTAKSFNIGTLKHGEYVEMIFAAELDSENITEAVKATKTLTDNGVWFEDDAMDEARTVSNDVFATAKNLLDENGKKVVVHDQVVPMVQNDEEVLEITPVTVKKLAGDYAKRTENDDKIAIFAVTVSNGENNPKNKNKYNFTYVPIFGGLSTKSGNCGDAKNSYIENLELCDRNGNPVDASSLNISNFKILRDQDGIVRDFEGLYNELSRPGVGKAQGETFYLKATFADQLWEEDRGVAGEPQKKEKDGHFQFSTKIVNVPDEHNKDRDTSITDEDAWKIERISNFDDPTVTTMDFKRTWLKKSVASEDKTANLNWKIDVEPTKTKCKRIFTDAITVTDKRLKQTFVGDVQILLTKDGEADVQLTKTLDDPDSDNFTYELDEQYWDYKATVTYQTKVANEPEYRVDGMIENKFIVDGDGSKHFDTAQVNISSGKQTGIRNPERREFEKELVREDDDTATWRITYNYLLQTTDFNDHGVKNDHIKDQVAYNNMYFEQEQFDSIAVSLGTKTLVKDVDYTITPIMYEDVEGSHNVEVLHGKIVGFDIEPLKTLGDGEHLLSVDYKTTIIKGKLGAFKEDTESWAPHNAVHDPSDPILNENVLHDTYKNNASVSYWVLDSDGQPVEHSMKASKEFYRGYNKEVFTYYSHRESDLLYWHVVVNANGYLGNALGIPSNKQNNVFDATIYANVPEGLEFEGAYAMTDSRLTPWVGEVPNTDIFGDPEVEDGKYVMSKATYYGQDPVVGAHSDSAPQRNGFGSTNADCGNESIPLYPNGVQADLSAIQNRSVPIRLKGINNTVRTNNLLQWQQFVVRTRITNEEVLLGVYPRPEPSDEPAVPKELRYDFSVEFKGDNLEHERLSDDAKSEVIKINPMTKTPSREDGSLIVDYDIEMNTLNLDLLEDKKVIRIFDTSSPTLMIRLGSIEVFDVKNNQKLHRISIAQAKKNPDLESTSYSVDASRLKDDHTIIFTVPDDRHLRITYKADIIPEIGADGSIRVPEPKNSAYFGDYMNMDHLSGEESSTEIYKSSGQLGGQNRITITKTDEQFTNLTDAEYAVERFDKDTNSWVPGAAGNIEFNGTSDEGVTESDVFDYVTINKKKLTITHPYTVYRFIEMKAPKDHAIDPRATYIVLANFEETDEVRSKKLKDMVIPQEVTDSKSKIHYVTRGSTLELIDKKLQKIQFKKVGIDTMDPTVREPLAGAKFELYNVEKVGDSYLATTIADIPVNKDPEKHNFKWESTGEVDEFDMVSGTYLLKEVEAPKRYQFMKPVFIELLADGTVITTSSVTHKNSAGEVVYAKDMKTQKKYPLNGNGERDVIELENELIHDVLLTKLEFGSEMPLDGVTFKLEKEKGILPFMHKTQEITLDGENEFTIENLERDTPYILTETKTRDSHILMDKKIRFVFNSANEVVDLAVLDAKGNPVENVGEFAKVNGKNNLVIYNKPKTVYISKKLFGSKSERQLAGVSFRLYDNIKNGAREPLYEFKLESIDTPYALHDIAFDKEYFIEEVIDETLKGIKQMPENQFIGFTLHEDGTVDVQVVRDAAWGVDRNPDISKFAKVHETTIDILNEQEKIYVGKYAFADKEKNLADVTLGLFTMDGEQPLEQWETTFTWREGSDIHEIQTVLDFGVPYRIKELAAPAIYEVPEEEIQFTYNLDGSIELKKLVPSADGTMSAVEMTDDFAVLGKVNRYFTDGYKDVPTIKMYNHIKRPKILKVDADDINDMSDDQLREALNTKKIKGLKGAEIKIYRPYYESEFSKEWVSEKVAYEFTDAEFEVNKDYEIHEVKAPEPGENLIEDGENKGKPKSELGYYAAPKQRFTLSDKGEFTAPAWYENLRIVDSYVLLTNEKIKPLSVVIEKVHHPDDKADVIGPDEKLKGVPFVVEKAGTNEIVFKGVTGDDGKIKLNNLVAGQYIIKETDDLNNEYKGFVDGKGRHYKPLEKDITFTLDRYNHVSINKDPYDYTAKPYTIIENTEKDSNKLKLPDTIQITNKLTELTLFKVQKVEMNEPDPDDGPDMGPEDDGPEEDGPRLVNEYIEGISFKVYPIDEFDSQKVHVKGESEWVTKEYDQGWRPEVKCVVKGLDLSDGKGYIIEEQKSPTSGGKAFARRDYEITIQNWEPVLNAGEKFAELKYGQLLLINEETAPITVRKIDAVTNEKLPGIPFNLYTEDEYKKHMKGEHNNKEAYTYKTNENGEFVLRGLIQEQWYVLEEKTPARYREDVIKFKLNDTFRNPQLDAVEIDGDQEAAVWDSTDNKLVVKNRPIPLFVETFENICDKNESHVHTDDKCLEKRNDFIYTIEGVDGVVIGGEHPTLPETLERNKEYNLVPDAIPEGKWVDLVPNAVTFKINDDGKVELTGDNSGDVSVSETKVVGDTLRIVRKKKHIYLTVNKLDASGNALAGAAFKIAGEELVPMVNGNVHTFEVTDLEVSKGDHVHVYTLEEIAPEGFKKAEDINFVIREDDVIVRKDTDPVTNVVKETKLTNDTIDVKNYRKLYVESFVTTDMDSGIIGESTPRTAGFVYDLYEDGNMIESITSIDRTLELPESLMPGKTYKLVSVQAPFGVALADDVVFEVKNDGMLQFKTTRSRKNVDVSPRISKHEVDGDVLQIIHRPLSLDVQKYEKVDSLDEATVLTGVTFEVLMNDKSIVKWESSKDAKTLVPYELAKKNLSETITLVETPKGGYVGIEPIEIRFTNTGSMLVDGFELVGDELKIFNHKTTVTIQKIDAKTQQPLTGAVFVVNGEGKAVDAEGKLIVEGLSFGNSYKVHEVSSPEGYMAGEDVTFELENDGQVVEVENKEAKYFIGSYFEKVQEGNELAGCEYLIKDGENVVSKVVSSTSVDEIVDALERNKTYTIEEVKVVDGIVYVDDVKFEINKRGELVLVGDYEHASMKGNDTIQIVHKPTRMDVRKVDESKHRLMGAVFELIDEDTNTVVHTWTSHDLKDEKIIKVLACDHRYVLKEVKVVDGYEDKQGDIHIAIDHNGRAMVENEVVSDKLIVKVNNKIQEAVVEEPKTPSKKETVVSNEHKLSTSTGDMLFVRNYAMVLVSAIVGVIVSCVRLMK